MPSALSRLPPDTQLAISHYTDPNSPAFSRQGKAWQLAKPHIQPASANNGAHRALQTDDVQEAVQEALALVGASYKVRIEALARAALGFLTDEVVTEQRDTNGKVTGTTVVKRPVPHSARVQYHKLLLQLTGEMDRARAQSKVQSEALLQTARRLRSRVSRAVDAEVVHVPAQPGTEAHNEARDGAEVESYQNDPKALRKAIQAAQEKLDTLQAMETVLQAKTETGETGDRGGKRRKG